jgi:hypothetical protein
MKTSTRETTRGEGRSTKKNNGQKTDKSEANDDAGDAALAQRRLT